MTERRTVPCPEDADTPQTTIPYTLTRKRVKNINLRITRAGDVQVSAAPRVPVSVIDAFVRRKAPFILHHTERLRAAHETRRHQYDTGDRLPFQGQALTLEVAAGPPSAVYGDGCLRLSLPDPADADARAALVRRWYAAEAESLLHDMMQRHLPRFEARGVAPRKLRIRDMTSRWGSCSGRTGAITLNARLAAVPPACAEYVVVHELCHLLHPNHSAAFYRAVAEVLPDWAARRAALRRFAADWGL